VNFANKVHAKMMGFTVRDTLRRYTCRCPTNVFTVDCGLI